MEIQILDGHKKKWSPTGYSYLTQNLLKLMQRSGTMQRDQIFEAETGTFESVSHNYGAK